MNRRGGFGIDCRSPNRKEDAGSVLPAAYMNQNQNMMRQFSSPTAWNGRSGEAVIPLPNPGEGGPVYPGNTDGGEAVIPLPNPGEGGPVYPGPDGGGVVEPVIPLPNPGEGGPVYPGPGGGNQTWPCHGGGCGGIIVLPGVIGGVWPGAAKVRFLNAGYGYPAFRVFVGNRRFVNVLNYASATTYGQVNAGYQTVTVTGTDGYVYIQKTMPFQSNGITTIAIINTAGGLDLMQITDSCCPPTNGYSSFRIGNLAYNSGPMDVIMSDGRVVWADLRFKEVPAFKRIMPGTYQFFYADTNLAPMPSGLDIETMDSAWLGVYPPHETFGSLYLDVTSNAIYSVYLLQSGRNRNNIQNLILMDR